MTQASLTLDQREEQKMKRKMSQAAESKMNRQANVPSELAGPRVGEKKENIFVRSLQEAGLEDLAQTETPMDEDEDSPSKGENDQSEDTSSATESDESDDVKDSWPDLMERCLKHILNKSDTQKALRILKQLDAIEEFTLTNESVLFFKKKKLGNIYILFDRFFGSEKKDAQLLKQLQNFRKVLESNKIKVTQRKTYEKKTAAKKTKGAKNANEDANMPKESPTVNTDLLNQLKK
jgi:hypothetical protein